MTDPSSSIADSNARRGLIACTSIPLALFPLVALLTYDWRAIPALNTPPDPSSNWIGALGDGFAYYGYSTFGLAVWIVPAICVLAAICVVRGRCKRPARRGLWALLFLASVSCILQVVGGHANAISAGVIGSLLLWVYSKTRAKKGSLDAKPGYSRLKELECENVLAAKKLLEE